MDDNIESCHFTKILHDPLFEVIDYKTSVCKDLARNFNDTVIHIKHIPCIIYNSGLKVLLNCTTYCWSLEICLFNSV